MSMIYVLEVFTNNSNEKCVRDTFGFESHIEALDWLCDHEEYEDALYKLDCYDTMDFAAGMKITQLRKCVQSETELKGAVPVADLKNILGSGKNEDN